MPLETDDLTQKAILYSKSPAVADTFGNPRIAAPVEIDCKFKFKTNLSGDPASGAVQIVGTVYVACEILVGSILRRGTLKKPIGETLYEVVGYNEIPDVLVEDCRRSVDIIFWHGTLPEAA